MGKVKVVQYGLGPIGIEAAKLVTCKKNFDLVGGIDIDPQKAGKDLGEVLGLNERLGIQISDNAEKVLKETQPQIVLHTTSSFLKNVESQLELCIQNGASVISSCEELFYPYHRSPRFCQKIDELAKTAGVAVLGTGVNPGFSMDVLVLCMTSVCTEVRKIKATRIVNAAKRRLPLLKKVGAGISPDEFRSLVNQGKLGHIGLVESLWAVNDALGWQLDQVKESIDPQIASQPIETPLVRIEPGQVTGILHRAYGSSKGETVIELELQMYAGAPEEYDRIDIEGDPPIHLKVEGGIFGDKATVARMVNAIPVVLQAAPGLKTAMSLPMAYFIP